jgi:hypothetical protein
MFSRRSAWGDSHGQTTASSVDTVPSSCSPKGRLGHQGPPGLAIATPTARFPSAVSSVASGTDCPRLSTAQVAHDISLGLRPQSPSVPGEQLVPSSGGSTSRTPSGPASLFTGHRRCAEMVPSSALAVQSGCAPQGFPARGSDHQPDAALGRHGLRPLRISSSRVQLCSGRSRSSRHHVWDVQGLASRS